MRMIIEIVLANGSARARPNRWMGGGQAPMHQVKSACCMPPTPHDHVGKKRRAYVHDQVGGWGRCREKNPRPRQVKSCHVTTPNCLRARLPFKNPD